jgi:hypothetical protein
MVTLRPFDRRTQPQFIGDRLRGLPLGSQGINCPSRYPSDFQCASRSARFGADTRKAAMLFNQLMLLHCGA